MGNKVFKHLPLKRNKLHIWLLMLDSNYVMQGSSCIDASNGFAGDLTITGTSFTANRSPLAVLCASTTNSSSCNMTMADSQFNDNFGAESLAMRLDCGTVSVCNFGWARTTFTNNSIDADSTHASTAAAIIVNAVGTATVLTLSLTSCDFNANDGAGLSAITLSGTVALSACSFLQHRALVNGLQATYINGATSVLLADSLWQGNMLGAMAVAQAQTSVVLARCSILDNIPSPTTLDTVDILMADTSPSSVSIIGSIFTNNSGYAFYASSASVYYAAGAVNIQSNVGYAPLTAIIVVIQDSSFVGNYGFLMPGAVSVFTALNTTMINSTFSSNIGGAIFLSGVQNTMITSSTFDSNYGNGRGDPAFVSAGGGGITWLACTNMQVADSLFVNNSAVNSGGAIHAQGTSSATSAFLATNVVFKGNKALSGSGGAVWVSSTGFAIIESSTFSGCSAAVAGGSVFAGQISGTGATDSLQYSNGVTIIQCNFTDSAAGLLPPGGWLSPDVFAYGPEDVAPALQLQGGGGVYVSQGSGVAVYNCMFSNCSAVRSRGGGLRLRGSQRSDIKSSIFTHCRSAAGGALSANSMLQSAGVLLGINGNMFANNTASTTLPCPVDVCIDMDITLVGTQGDGGAANVDGCDLLLYNRNSFTSNFASGRGGAIFAQRPADSSRIFSYADAQVLDVHPAPASFPHVYSLSFVNNTALVAGGALAMQGFQLTISPPVPSPLWLLDPSTLYTLFQGNTAPAGKQFVGLIQSAWFFFMILHIIQNMYDVLPYSKCRVPTDFDWGLVFLETFLSTIGTNSSRVTHQFRPF